MVNINYSVIDKYFKNRNYKENIKKVERIEEKKEKIKILLKDMRKSNLTEAGIRKKYSVNDSSSYANLWPQNIRKNLFPSSQAKAGIELQELAASLPAHLIGLKNLGNTCYINSTIQALLGLPMAAGLASVLPQPDPRTKLLLPFIRLVAAKEEGDAALASQCAAKLKSEIEVVDSMFAGFNQQDANEFLTRFLETLRNDLQSGLGLGQQDLVTSTFQFERDENIEYMGCGAVSVSLQRDLGLYCQVTANPHTSLQHLVGRGLGKSEERERRCEPCGSERASAASSITRGPPVLLLTIKCYNESGQKLNTSIDIPEQLNLGGTTPARKRAASREGSGNQAANIKKQRYLAEESEQEIAADFQLEVEKEDEGVPGRRRRGGL